MIDLHAHVVLAPTMGGAGRHGPELLDGSGGAAFRAGDYVLRGVDYRNTPFMDPALRLAAMDERGIELAVLSPNPLTYFPRIEVELATSYARVHNDALAAVVADAPDRLAGLAQVPTQDPSTAAAEAVRAVDSLSLSGVSICATLDRPLDDPSLDELYATCVDLDVPLFVHPAPAAATGAPRDPRLERFDAELWAGFAHDETLAVAELVLGGVLARHPALDVCVSHGGGATPLMVPRMATAARQRGWADEAVAAPGAVEGWLRRMWWDGHVGGPDTLGMLAEAFGSDRLVAGTNFGGWDDDAEHWSDVADPDVLDQNARRLLRLT